MSGIAGILYLDGRQVEPPAIQGMAQIMALHGPDAQTSWHDGSVGLAHAMLRVTPESQGETQPASSADGALTITADARIDNRAALLEELGRGGRPLSEITDSDLILRAYERWGDDCPKQLVGDFAFAIWDSRRQLLFCARDHMGARPFFYFRSESLVAIASEIRPLLSLKEVPQRLNEARLGDYLLNEMFFVDQERAPTMYQNIFRLAAGHTLTVDQGGARTAEYWRLDPTRELRLGSDAEYADAFRDLFTEAVRCRLRSTSPVGSMLSGGLDSSSVSCVARDILVAEGRGPLPVFSAVYPSTYGSDETPFIEAVVAQGGVEPNYIQAEEISPFDDVDDPKDEVFLTPNGFILRAIYRRARELGVRVILDGLDGDLTVSHGRAAVTELAGRGRFLAAAREASALARRFDLGSRRIHARRIFWHRAIRANMPEFVRLAWRAVRRRNEDVLAAHPIVRRDFAERSDLADRAKTYAAARARLPRTAREEHWSALTAGYIEHQFETADRDACPSSVEPRHPFSDRRLVEFCLSLPARQKLHDGWVRAVLRRALSDTLPEEVCWRPGKADLSLYIPAGLLAHERDRIDDTLRDPGRLADYVDMAVVRTTYDRLLSTGEVRDAGVIWQVVALATWLRQIEQQTFSKEEVVTT